jgi:hypothetical protein
MASAEAVREVSTPETQKCRLSVASFSAASLVGQGEERALPILGSYMYASLGASIGRLGSILGASKFAMTLMFPGWGIWRIALESLHRDYGLSLCR